MKNGLKKAVAVILAFSFVFITSFSTLSLTSSERSKLNSDIAKLQKESKAIQSEINSLKAKKNNQSAVLAAVRRKIANTQAQINRCNQEISGINAKISANKAKINEKNKSIESTKLQFKKRLRAIYMSESDSNLKLLLGAENFSDFLQLSQLTSSVSSRDKAMMDELVAAIKELNKKNEENQKLLDSQVAIRETIAAKQAELQADENEAESIYNGIDSKENSNKKEKAAIDSKIRAMQKKLEDDIRARDYVSFINPANNLMWPVSGFRSISAGFQSNDSVHRGHHNGIDIAGGGIAGQPIRAISDGYVTLVHNGCRHNYKKYGNCCGNGYGNYCVVNHGKISGSNYVAYYAHASSIIVSNGAHVKQGQVLGYVGTTGWSTGYHLHLGIMRNGSWVNPYPLFF
ncbi:MAG: peptidoglycan DD-metalloendopeptidase family protein [Clostridia bacterium]|nr:peptidoglycan DD-metalloendopeptidase family protein [Clostridia bacterium]